MDQERKVKLNSYYERCLRNNELWWHLDQSYAIHAGYWDESTKNLSEALQKENEILARLAKIRPTDYVLDIGCGVGGSAIYLASMIGCQVVGIDLGELLIERARKYAKKCEIEALVEFRVMDYNSMRFCECTFDVVWVLESLCHAEEKENFIKETFRLLKPKGRLIIADGFCERDVDKRFVTKARDYFGLSEYMKKDDLKRIIENSGFINYVHEDISKHVIPSARRLYYYSIPLVIWSKIGEYFGWSTNERTEDFKGYYCQYRPLREGVFSYGIVYAEKP